MIVDVPTTSEADAQVAISDRRRPGRQAAAPELINLLRPPAEDDEIPDDLRRLLEDEGELPIQVDPIAPARGIAWAIGLSVPIWAAIIGALTL
jgi:hypothetical protein